MYWLELRTAVLIQTWICTAVPCGEYYMSPTFCTYSAEWRSAMS